MSILTVLLSCKKVKSELENQESSSPIYNINGIIDNKDINYMVDDSAVFLTYGTGDINGIKTFYSKIENPLEKSSIKLIFTKPEIIHPNISNYNTSNLSIPFLVHEKQCFNFNFDIFSGNYNLDYFSYFSNNQFIKSSEIEIEEKGIHRIDVRFKGISSNTYTQTINYGFESKLLSAYFELNNNSNFDKILFTATNTNHNHQWFINGQSVGNNQSFGELSLKDDGVYKITHIITDDYGNNNEYSILFYSSEYSLAWLLNTKLCNNSTNKSSFENISIEYEKDGELYTSINTKSNKNKSVSLTNIEYFIDDSSNSLISTKFDISFNCDLYNQDLSKKIEFKDIKGTFKYDIK